MYYENIKFCMSVLLGLRLAIHDLSPPNSESQRSPLYSDKVSCFEKNNKTQTRWNVWVACATCGRQLFFLLFCCCNLCLGRYPGVTCGFAHDPSHDFNASLLKSIYVENKHRHVMCKKYKIWLEFKVSLSGVTIRIIQK